MIVQMLQAFIVGLIYVAIAGTFVVGLGALLLLNWDAMSSAMAPRSRRPRATYRPRRTARR